MYHFKEMANHL